MSLSRLCTDSVNGKLLPIAFIVFCIISKGKKRLLKKNIGSAITNDVNRAVFSEFDNEPINKPSIMKFIAVKSRIITELNVIFIGTPNKEAIMSIAIISIMLSIRKYNVFATNNVGILIGLKSVLANVPLFLSSTMLEEVINSIVNNRSVTIKPDARKLK